jgi:hypothetical protein
LSDIPDAAVIAARKELLRWCSVSEVRNALAAALPHLVAERDADVWKGIADGKFPKDRKSRKGKSA